jgi:GT2 family glycosyltransferase
MTPKKILISVLAFYKEDMTEKFLRSFLTSLKAQIDPKRWELTFVLSLNYPAQEPQKFERLMTEAESLRCILRQNQGNRGFGGGHNEVVQNFPGMDFLLVLNNDLFLDEPLWLTKLLEPFSNSLVGIVGLQNAPRFLNHKGTGRAGPQGRPSEYLEGSLMAIRASCLDDRPLFDEEFHWAYYEDSDLSLRLRARGFQIVALAINHEHLRSESARVIPSKILAFFGESNKKKFLIRWLSYLRTRQLSNRICLDFKAEARKQIAALIPLLALRKKWPNTELLVEADRPETAELLQALGFQASEEPLAGKLCDQHLFLEDAQATALHALVQEVAQTWGFETLAPTLWDELRDRLRALPPVSLPLAESEVLRGPLVVFQQSPSQGPEEGFDVPDGILTALLNQVLGWGMTPVLIGGGAGEVPAGVVDLRESLSVRQLLALVEKASLFVGIDAEGLQAAQVFGLPCFTFWGPSLPSSRLVDAPRVWCVARTELACLGCHHLSTGDREKNFCLRRDLACLKYDPAKVLAEFQSFWTSRTGNPGSTMQALISTYSALRMVQKPLIDRSKERRFTLRRVIYYAIHPKRFWRRVFFD